MLKIGLQCKKSIRSEIAFSVQPTEQSIVSPEASEDTDNVEDSAQYTVHVAPDYQEPSWESHSVRGLE